MEQFGSGWKKNYYGKGDVVVYKLNREGATPAGQPAVFAANVTMLVYGDAFWSTYTTGDNSGLIATDSMKNFIQHETLHYPGPDLEEYCRFLAAKFIDTYPQVEGVQVSCKEIPYAGLAHRAAFAPSGPERATARIELSRHATLEATSGIQGFKLLRLGGSSFQGFVRDRYTTLPDIKNRPLHMWLDLEWLYTEPAAAFSSGAITAQVRSIVSEVFQCFESGSIQQVIYQIGEKILADIAAISEVHLEANNRTWDTVVEQGAEVGVFTDARPPFGILGLRMRR